MRSKPARVVPAPTKRQAKAARLEQYVKARLERIDRDWKRIACWLSQIHAEKLFEEWDFANFGEYAESIGISSSLAYDLAGANAGDTDAGATLFGIELAEHGFTRVRAA